MSINECKNYGKVESEKSRKIGGIIGWHRGGKAEIKNTSNYGDITSNYENAGSNFSGGIIGFVGGANWEFNLDVDILNCVNFGNVSSLITNRDGGLIGRQDTCCAQIYVTVKNFYNVGKIKSGNIIGEIAYTSRTETKTEFENVYYIKEPAIGRGSLTSGEATLKSHDKIKSQSFVDLLNQNIGENSDWKKWKLGEKGYPEIDL